MPYSNIFFTIIASKKEDILTQRDTCYTCYRPKSSCMCQYINPIETKTKFIILMHPKEYKKTKNGTGHFTHKSLKNSELHIGIDFTKHERINSILSNKNNACFILYPGEDSIKLNEEPINTDKNIVLFIIDSTWPCSKKILRVSKNLQNLGKVSFQSDKESNFKIKTQPDSYCLSTIESTQYIIELLNKHELENVDNKSLNEFTKPFEQMVKYQVKCSYDDAKPRYKK